MHRAQTKAPPVSVSALSPEWIILNATVFISSASIMMIELVAGRIIARHLGASVYTWTSVIGIVLAGIAVGNYLGGLIADRYSSRRTLAMLFMAGSIMSGAITLFDRFASDLSFLWTLSWPVRVALHVGLVFFVPTCFLGMISPVIAKMALDLGRERGRTIGDIYAFGVVGSIIGTFIAGYFLISALGTLGVVWSVAIILAAMAVYYHRQSPVTWIWAVAACLLTVFATSQAGWASSIGESLLLRLPRDEAVLYQTESDYSYIEIVQFSKDPDIRGMHLDTLLHSQKEMGKPGDFRYAYEKVYLSITRRLRPNATRIDSLTIGGGGYVYPQFMNSQWPEGRTDVVEIDPAVTEAAMAAFGLPRDTTIRCFHEDGRVYIDRLVADKRAGKAVEPYDFIYCDAVNDYSVPHQLTTKEFMSAVKELIRPDGAYLMNMIDIYDSGLLLGSLISTMQDVFPYVNVLVENQPITFADGTPNKQFRATRMTFIIAGTNQPLDTAGLGPLFQPDCQIFALSKGEMDSLRSKTGYATLTDEFAPVEILLAPVVKDSSLQKAVEEWNTLAKKKVLDGQYDEGIRILNDAIAKIPDPATHLALVETMGNAYQLMGRFEDARQAFEKVLTHNAASVRAEAGLVTCYTELRQPEKAMEHFAKLVKLEPNDETLRYDFAGLLLSNGKAQEAASQLQEAIRINPEFCDAYNNLGVAYSHLKDVRSSVASYRRALQCDESHTEARKNLDRILGVDSATIEAEIQQISSTLRPDSAEIDAARKLYGLYYSLQQCDEAMVWLDRVLAAQPDDLDALIKRANCCVELQRLDEAIETYRRGLRVDPTNETLSDNIRKIEEYRQKNSQP